MSEQSKVTSYYSRKRKGRNDCEPSAKRKRQDDRVSIPEEVVLAPTITRTTRSKRSAASAVLDSLFGDEVESPPAEPAAPCELFAPKVSYHGRARRNVGSILSLSASKARATSTTKKPEREWCQAPKPIVEERLPELPAAKSAASRFASLAAPMSLTSSKAKAINAPGKVLPLGSVSVQTKGQSSVGSSTVNDDSLPSSRFQHLAAPFQPVSTSKTSPTLPMPTAYRRLQEKMVATDNLLCLRRQFAGSFTQVKEGVQRMTQREYTVNDVARMTTVLPPAYVLSQEKVEKGYELHLKLNSAWKEDLAKGQGTSASCLPPTDTKQVIRLKLERKEAFRERLASRVFDCHQDFLAGLNVKPEEGKPLTHWHPKFKIDSLPAIPCAELPALPTSKACSSASEVLQLNTIKSEKVGRALQAVAEATQKSRQECVSPSRKETPLEKVTLTPPPTPSQSEPKSKVASMKGIPSSLLEKIRKREAEKEVMTMTCPVEREQEMQLLDKLPEICRVMCSLFISERKDVLEMGVVVKGLHQSISSLQACSPGQLEEYVSTLADKLKKWISIVSLPSRPRRYVKLVPNAKTHVAVLLSTLSKCREEFDAEIRASMT